MLSALTAILGGPLSAEGSMPWCCSEFKMRMLGDYTKTTQDDYVRYLTTVADVFEQFHAADVTTKDWADFLRAKFNGKANTAKKVTALGGKLFRFIIGELGLRPDNPIDQLDMSSYKTRTRTVLAAHDQVMAIRTAGAVGVDGRQTRSGPIFACIIDMTYLCWQRAKDIRTLEEVQIKPLSGGGLVGGSITFEPSKTKVSSGLAVEIVITPAIAKVIERARAIKRQHHIVSGYLFPATAGKHAGHPYAKSGLCSMWDRARERAVTEANKEGREFGALIQFKDLQALGATDAAARGEDLGEIQKRLVHTSGDTTGIYIKKVIPKVSDLAIDLPWSDLKPQK
ncbi:hypothetical protein [Pseudoduganella violacea]|uniref:Integrase n=1 Tax=Pseudoduganella violacea TaxID=1715466 RepID=A0A7W5FU72_9BURK|nr:hypothetical protein [Pseudoduganella violacea]MBB3118883.1 integrase [Pseudoduganella violacea]